ncbi:hypothetical protein [Helicobacter sp. T3_23-1059]
MDTLDIALNMTNVFSITNTPPIPRAKGGGFFGLLRAESCNDKTIDYYADLCKICSQ